MQHVYFIDMHLPEAALRPLKYSQSHNYLIALDSLFCTDELLRNIAIGFSNSHMHRLRGARAPPPSPEYFGHGAYAVGAPSQ